MEDESFLFWQLNCHRSKLVHDQIEKRVEETTTRPILMLQEQNVSRMPGYLVFQSGAGPRSRAGILVPEEIKFVHLEEYSSTDTCSGLLKCEGGADLVLASAYMDSSHQNIDEHLIKTIEYARDKNLKCLISCDSNAWSTVWGSARPNHRESLILDLLIEYNLTTANVGSIPTFSRDNAESVIDLTIGSNGLEIDNWKVEEEADMLSDHRLISFRIDKRPVKLESKLTRDIRTANWHLFRSLLKDELCFSSRHYWSKADLEKESRHVTKSITDALDIVAPLKQRKSRGKPSIWSNPEYRALSNKVKAANRRRRRRPTEHSIAKYKQYRNELTDLKRKIEADRWKEFVETIQDPKDLSKFAKMKNPMTKIKGLKREDTLLTEDCDVADILREAHFPGSVIDPDPGRVPEVPDNDQKCDVHIWV